MLQPHHNPPLKHSLVLPFFSVLYLFGASHPCLSVCLCFCCGWVWARSPLFLAPSSAHPAHLPTISPTQPVHLPSIHCVNVFSNHSSPQCSFYLSNSTLNTKLELACSKSALMFLITKLSPFFLLQEHHPAARQSAYPTKTSFNLLYTLLRSLYLGSTFTVLVVIDHSFFSIFRVFIVLHLLIWVSVVFLITRGWLLPQRPRIHYNAITTSAAKVVLTIIRPFSQTLDATLQPAPAFGSQWHYTRLQPGPTSASLDVSVTQYTDSWDTKSSLKSV